ncbi:HAD-like domain-containing protein [Verticillium dahliae]|nr:HAD-like domain-containing protein [Verticillium dahliae]
MKASICALGGAWASNAAFRRHRDVNGSSSGLPSLSRSQQPVAALRPRWLSAQASSTTAVPPSFAFAFDIDGVLLHVAKPIPGAREALEYLQDNNIPFILLTNGGGKHEHDRVRDLSDKLGVQLTVDNFVQSHTPFQELVRAGPDSLSDKTVFVTGSNAQKCREIAEQYGFRSVVTPADILTAHPEIWPFEPLMEEVYRATARPLPRPLHGPGVADADALTIDAMFVFNDPRDWALDVQLILDLLLSRRGILGTYSDRNGDASLPNAGWQQDGQPPLILSNSDLLWSTGYHQPRLGQGAFQEAVAAVWAKVTGGTPLRRTAFGKPSPETYRYAERVLNEHRAALLARQGRQAEASTPLRTVYMVGDNPESDIRGANEYRSKQGTNWESVLVRTGVWQADRGESAYPPTAIVDDVKAAVAWALAREQYIIDGSMGALC